MGNYSYLICDEGCQIDVTKLVELSKDIEGYSLTMEEDIKKIEEEGIGTYIDGWKIQGYWYDNFNKFLIAVLNSIIFEVGKEAKGYNMIEMEEEQGYKFWIHFYVENGKKVCEVEYVPMEIQHFIIGENGEQIDN